jgi:phosphohistidine phosphatase SixA
VVRRRIVLAALALGLFACRGPEQHGRVITLVLVRHAEKLSDTDPDSPLSEAGLARARALVPQLAAFRPDVLVVSQRQRTAQTLAPLAAKLGMAPLVRDNSKVAELAQEIRTAFQGKTVVLAWHHGPHEPLVRALGVQGPLPAWTATTYDRIWIVRIDARGRAGFEERRQAPVP